MLATLQWDFCVWKNCIWALFPISSPFRWITFTKLHGKDFWTPLVDLLRNIFILNTYLAATCYLSVCVVLCYCRSIQEWVCVWQSILLEKTESCFRLPRLLTYSRCISLSHLIKFSTYVMQFSTMSFSLNASNFCITSLLYCGGYRLTVTAVGLLLGFLIF